MQSNVQELVTLESLAREDSSKPGDNSPSLCCCSQALKRDRVRAADVGLSLLGVLGWLALPKCPLCLAAYLAIGTGLSISVRGSRALYVVLAALTAGLFMAGAWRITKIARRQLMARVRQNRVSGHAV